MVFTYSIKEPNYYPDQWEEKGIINLEKAIELFQTYPFFEQLKFAESLNQTYCFPSIKFTDDNNRSLIIWVSNYDGFELSYNNQSEHDSFSISNNLVKNAYLNTVEEFIELFFDGNIENRLDLRAITIDKRNLDIKRNEVHTFLANKTKKVKFLYATLLTLGLSVYLLFKDLSNTNIPLAVHLLIAIFWAPGVYLHVTYWLKSKNSSITIEPLNDYITYRNRKEILKFHRTEIEKCEHHNCLNSKAPWNQYEFLRIILKDSKKIELTCFIEDPLTILELTRIHYSPVDRIIPAL